MGEARRRKLAAEKLAGRLGEAAEQVSSALRKYAHAASTHMGSDCYVHAELGCALLADLGIESRPVVGFAAWRVGAADGDVIAHSPQVPGYLISGSVGMAYHAWLDVSGFILDFTTYQLRRKAAELDNADGGYTEVEWCPDYLLLTRAQTHPYKSVVAAVKPGAAYYEPRYDMNLLLRRGFKLDPEDLATARLIMQNPNVTVYGPNSLAR